MNNTNGENGLDQTRLEFRILNRLPILNSELQNRKGRFEALKTAQAEMNTIIADRHIQTALSADIPWDADRKC